MGIVRRVRVCKLCVRLFSGCDDKFLRDILYIESAAVRNKNAFTMFAQSRGCGAIHVCNLLTESV